MKMLGRKSLVMCAIGMIAFTSCKKDIVEIPESNAPVFATKGVLGMESFEIIAGDNGAFMYTMTQVENGVEVFSGRISNGSLSVEMGIYDGSVDKPAAQPALELGNLTPIFSHVGGEPLITLSKNVLASMSAGQYIETIEWYVDGDHVGTNEAEINSPGKFEVCAEITYLDGEIRMLCNEMIVGYELGANCMIDFSIGSQGGLTAAIDNMGTSLSQVIWFIDGNQVSENNLLQTNVSSGSHTLSAMVYFTNGVVREKSVLVDGSNWQHACNDFTIFEYQAPSILPRDFNVRLFIEKDGKEYSSELAENENSSIVITGLEFYDENAAGNPVYKVSATVDARVREAGSLKNIPVSFNTIFGIEIK